MSITALMNARIWIAEHDLVDDTNEVTVDWEAAELDRTTFGSGGKRVLVGGIESVQFNVKGFLNFAASQSDAALSAVLGQTGKVVTVAADSSAGSTAVFAKAMKSKLQRGAKVGDLSMFDGTLSGSAKPGLVEGVLLAAEQTVTSSTNVSGIQHGAVASGESAYAALHVFAASGSSPTLDVKIQSDDNGSFTSPTDRITFTQAGDVTSEWGSVAGAITDDYWRVVATVGGSSPSFTFAVSFGIA